jgi:TPR repeat protein
VQFACQLNRILFAIAIAALAASDGSHAKERPVPNLPDIQAKLAFKCAYEKDVIPPRDPDADRLYKYARWLEKNNQVKDDPRTYPKIERLLRIATAYGHDKANLELRQMIGNGQAHSDDPVRETLSLTDELIRRGIPGGYYDMGYYIEHGYGVEQDSELALKYYRKSADLGSPEGQFLVAEKLNPPNMAPEVAEQMYRCAAEQGHGEAANSLGNEYAGLSKEYLKALWAFQLGVRAGNASAARFMQHGFDGPATDNRLYYLGQQRDPERVSRYKIIAKVLSDYSYLNPKVPEIDKIVPLPPAKLPPWDGKLQWLKEHEANVPPPLPSEARIEEMARAKGLDPATGRRLQAR